MEGRRIQKKRKSPVTSYQRRALQLRPLRPSLRPVVSSRVVQPLEMCCCNSAQYIALGRNGSGKEAAIGTQVSGNPLTVRSGCRVAIALIFGDANPPGAGRSGGKGNLAGRDRGPLPSETENLLKRR